MKQVLFVMLAVVFLSVNVASGEKAAAPAVTPAKEMKAEIKLGTSIEKMNIAGEASSFPAGTLDVWCWTRISGATEPTKVYHVWEYNGKEMAKIELDVKYSPHRTWSVKRILPEWSGEWKVTVTDAAGNKIGEATFKMEKPAAPAAIVTPESKPAKK